jgi:hypothetical protein
MTTPSTRSAAMNPNVRESKLSDRLSPTTTNCPEGTVAPATYRKARNPSLGTPSPATATIRLTIQS